MIALLQGGQRKGRKPTPFGPGYDRATDRAAQLRLESLSSDLQGLPVTSFDFMLPPNFCGHRFAFLSRPLGQNALRGEDCYRKVRFNPLIPYSRPMHSCGHYRVLTDEQFPIYPATTSPPFISVAAGSNLPSVSK
jgi:hypothetical protein